MEPDEYHTHNLVHFALAMQEATKSFLTPDQQPILLRVGIHTGFVIAGVRCHNTIYLVFHPHNSVLDNFVILSHSDYIGGGKENAAISFVWRDIHHC